MCAPKNFKKEKNVILPDYLQTLKPSDKTDNYGPDIGPDICEALRTS